MNHMGMVVKEIRESLNWSVVRLEEKSGVSRRVIYDIERRGGGRLDTYEWLLGAMGYELEVVKKDGWGICG